VFIVWHIHVHVLIMKKSLLLSKWMYVDSDSYSQTRIWIAVLAFDLLFGTIFLKTWRAYYAVLSKNRRKKKGEKMIKMKVQSISSKRELETY